MKIKPNLVRPSESRITTSKREPTICLPVNTPINAPVNTPVNTPVDAPVNTPVNAPVNTPVNTPVNAPVNTPINAPIDAPVDAPVDTPVNTPINAPPPLPVRDIVESPLIPSATSTVESAGSESVPTVCSAATSTPTPDDCNSSDDCVILHSDVVPSRLVPPRVGTKLIIRAAVIDGVGPIACEPTAIQPRDLARTFPRVSSNPTQYPGVSAVKQSRSSIINSAKFTIQLPIEQKKLKKVSFKVCQYFVFDYLRFYDYNIFILIIYIYTYYIYISILTVGVCLDVGNTMHNINIIV